MNKLQSFLGKKQLIIRNFHASQLQKLTKSTPSIQIKKKDMSEIAVKNSSLVQSLKWRYATKKFDTTKKVSEADLATLLECIQLTATSYGLQPYKVLNVDNAALRAKMQVASWGQSQVVDASHVLVFCAYNEVTSDMIDKYVALKANTQGIPLDKLKGYGDFMKDKIGAKTPSEVLNWNARQIYIALGNLLAACGELNIDACPMEGFEPHKYDEILGLKAKGLTAVVVCPIGYRSAEDMTQHAPKVRKPLTELFETI